MLIQELQLHANDLSALKTFYCDSLGFKMVANNADNFTVQCGTSKLTFLKTHLINAKPYYHFAFNIPSNQIKDAHNWLKTKQIEAMPTEIDEATNQPIYIAAFDAWQAEAVYFYDPAGNIVEFIARHEFSRPSSKPFSMENVISISEIGLVAVEKDSKEYAAELREKYDLTSFQKGTNRTDFWALGADNGLLLAFREGRKYFPTDLPAARFPLKVFFENRKNIDCELQIW
ncbi:MAG: Metallothiol transferase FosB [Bacteroidota bacterium]